MNIPKCIIVSKIMCTDTEIWVDCTCTRMDASELKDVCPKCNGTGKIRVLTNLEQEREIKKETI